MQLERCMWANGVTRGLIFPYPGVGTNPVSNEPGYTGRCSSREALWEKLGRLPMTGVCSKSSFRAGMAEHMSNQHSLGDLGAPRTTPTSFNLYYKET
jgi:hypothetical protein